MRICNFVLIASLVVSVNAFAQNPKADQVVKSYSDITESEMDELSAITNLKWSQKRVIDRFELYLTEDENDSDVRVLPYAMESEVAFIFSQGKNKTYFQMPGRATAPGKEITTRENPSPLHKLGYKRLGSKVSYLIWAGGENWASVIHPSAFTAANTDELKKLFEKDSRCPQKYYRSLDCVLMFSIYDYLIIDADLNDLTTIKVTGKKLDQTDSVFESVMTPKADL